MKEIHSDKLSWETLTCVAGSRVANEHKQAVENRTRWKAHVWAGRRITPIRDKRGGLTQSLDDGTKKRRGRRKGHLSTASQHQEIKIPQKLKQQKIENQKTSLI